MGLPPVFVGAVQLTIAEAFPLVGRPMVGTPGVEAGVTLAEEFENEPVPTTLMAATVNVYAAPLVRPVTVQLVEVLDVEEGHAFVVGVEVVTFSDVTVYPVIALPPVLVGAVQLTFAEAFPLVGVSIAGTPGVVAGVALAEEPEKRLVPMLLMAATVNVYTSPLVRPVTVQLVEVLDVEEGHASVVGVEVVTFSDVTVYPAIALPPMFDGAVQLTLTNVLPLVTAPIVGAPGTAAGVTLTEEFENEPVPTTLMAATVNVYASPLVRPVTIQVVAVLDFEEGHASVVGVAPVVAVTV